MTQAALVGTGGTCGPELGLVGVGAFGAFALPHLAPHFAVHAHDPKRDLRALELPAGVRVADLATAASRDVVVLAMPVQQLGAAVEAVRPHLKPGALVLDVCSVKVKPSRLLLSLPGHVDIVGTHPLFGPQSGKDGIRGLRIVVTPLRGERAGDVVRFLESKLGLRAILTTPEQHDRQMAYVQGLTHLVSRVIVAMDLPDLDQATPTFELLLRMVETVRYDSDELFRAICTDNPFVEEVKAKFFAEAARIEQRLAEEQAPDEAARRRRA